MLVQVLSTGALVHVPFAASKEEAEAANANAAIEHILRMDGWRYVEELWGLMDLWGWLIQYILQDTTGKIII